MRRAARSTAGSRAAPHPADAPRRRTFCGYCGKRPEGEPEPGSRVCGDCGLGLLLTADEALAPEPSDAFLVVDAGLAIRALSKGAEKLFAVAETDVLPAVAVAVTTSAPLQPVAT